MQKQILFLHDTSLATPRGAELTIKELISLGEDLGYIVHLDYLKNLDDVKGKIARADLVVLNSSSDVILN